MNNPENDTIALQLRSRGHATQLDDKGNPTATDSLSTVTATIDKFESYAFNSDYLAHTDGFEFTIGDENLVKSTLDAIYVGQEVSLSINGHVQAGGYIDNVDVESSRSGSRIHLHGRGYLSPAVDAHIDPTLQFQSSQTLSDVIVACFTNYGFPDVGQIITDDEANGNIITGQVRGLKTTKKGKNIKSQIAHQFKPYPHESVFAFASRLSQRFGLWIRVSADGQTLIVDTPDFTQKSIYSARNKLDGINNNVLEAKVRIQSENQPTVLVCSGVGGGGDQSRAGLWVACVNELTGTNSDGTYRPEVVEILDSWPQAVELPFRDEFNDERLLRMSSSRVRTLYLHDDESKTVDELSAFARREMSLHQREALVAEYTFEGHTLDGVPWCINAIADVDDDVTRLHNRMWVKSRTFTKSRTEGTRTKIEMILPYTLEF